MVQERTDVGFDLLFGTESLSESLRQVRSYCNIYNHILGGSIGALDAISAFPNHPSRKVSRTLDGDSFTVNFPLQIDDPATYPYKYLDGTLARIVKLMTEEEKAAVLADYTMDKLFEREIV